MLASRIQKAKTAKAVHTPITTKPATETRPTSRDTPEMAFNVSKGLTYDEQKKIKRSRGTADSQQLKELYQPPMFAPEAEARATQVRAW